jgi:hypothetical protein
MVTHERPRNRSTHNAKGSEHLPDPETVRGRESAGQTERELPIGSRAVKHDLGALELLADDQADSRRQNVDGALSSRKGGSAPRNRL